MLSLYDAFNTPPSYINEYTQRPTFSLFRRESPRGQKIARLLGGLAGYVAAKKAHNKYGDKNDRVEKYGSRYGGATLGVALGQALYNKATGKGFTLKKQYEWHLL